MTKRAVAVKNVNNKSSHHYFKSYYGKDTVKKVSDNVTKNRFEMLSEKKSFVENKKETEKVSENFQENSEQRIKGNSEMNFKDTDSKVSDKSGQNYRNNNLDKNECGVKVGYKKHTHINNVSTVNAVEIKACF